MDRLSHGEHITDDSWLMRDLWQTTEMNYGAKEHWDKELMTWYDISGLTYKSSLELQTLLMRT
jgi:hypothetical protein